MKVWILILIVLGGVLVLPVAAKERVLNSPLAGRWYEADANLLRKQLQGYLDKAKPVAVKNLRALVLPHAGYRYSGQTAAYGIKLLKGRQYKRVIVLGPTHRVYMKNAISVPNYTHYQTPLGNVPLDLDFINKLKQNSAVKSLDKMHRYEHSVQIEVPLLQMVLKRFKLVPIVVGQLDEKAADKIGRLLLNMIDGQTLVVASSDFTHYGAHFDYMPFRQKVEENIKKLDLQAYEYIRKLDLKGFYRYLAATRATICGRCSIALILAMLPKNAKVTLLNYDTSGRMLNDFSSSVSYMSIAFAGTWQRDGAGTSNSNIRLKKKEQLIKERHQCRCNDSDAGSVFGKSSSSSNIRLKKKEQLKKERKMEQDNKKCELNDQDKANLLKLARKTVEYVFKHKKPPAIDELGIELTPGMKQVMGAFVTLHKNGHLRGCIGEIEPRRELYKAVIDHAVNSAFRDYRFNQLSESELPVVDFEISALTPSRSVPSYNDIVIGKHGMTVSKDGRSAVFLPQVAPEQGWDIAETLTHLSMKAGLSADAWKQPGATFTVFEAIVFGEKEREHK